MTSPSSIATVVDVVDRKPYLSLLDERFGIPRSVFDDYLLVKPYEKKLYLVHKDHRPALRPKPMTTGMPFMRIYLKAPKLSTAAAMHFGRTATKNIIAARPEQAEAYLTRQPFSPFAEQLAACTGRGYVLISHDGVTLGVGFLTTMGEEANVKSMFPKAWARSKDSFSM